MVTNRQQNISTAIDLSMGMSELGRERNGFDFITEWVSD